MALTLRFHCFILNWFIMYVEILGLRKARRSSPISQLLFTHGANYSWFPFSSSSVPRSRLISPVEGAGESCICDCTPLVGDGDGEREGVGEPGNSSESP